MPQRPRERPRSLRGGRQVRDSSARQQLHKPQTFVTFYVAFKIKIPPPTPLGFFPRFAAGERGGHRAAPAAAVPSRCRRGRLPRPAARRGCRSSARPARLAAEANGQQ